MSQEQLLYQNVRAQERAERDKASQKRQRMRPAITDQFPRVSKERIAEMKSVASFDYSYHLTSAEFHDLRARLAAAEKRIVELETAYYALSPKDTPQ